MKIIILSSALLFINFNLFGQDYSQQVNAFAQSFEDKATDAIATYISEKLTFGNIPATSTSAILNNIVSKLPKLKSLKIIESEQGKVKVEYDFEAFGQSQSLILFDEYGKIIRIQLVEDLINQEAEARRQQKVPLPTPGELGEKYTPQNVEFKAADNLLISGHLYEIDDKKPVILLTHQAGYNRMEYADIAPKLNQLGYNCLAIDLRSGGIFNGRANETNKRAIEKGLQPSMPDAQQDIRAAVNYLHQKYQQKVIVWGSSFSSSLALIEGIDNTNINTIIAFSPGDYFGNSTPSLSHIFPRIKQPYLITSSKAEAETLSSLKGQPGPHQVHFIPKSNGLHGSRVLWEGQEDAQEYWSAIKEFLKSIAPTNN